MEYKEEYFESGKKYNEGKGLYRIKKFLPIEGLVHKKSAEHYNLLLLEKWKFLYGCNNVLDAGCGRGQFMEINPDKVNVTGVDILKSEVEEANKKGLIAYVGDISKKLNFKNNSFDGIILSHVLEHLDKPEKTLQEFNRILKDGGLLVIAVPNFSFKQFYKDPTHKRPYPKEALFRILNDYGFKDIKIKNGPHLNQVISTVFFFFPKIRHFFEKVLGRVRPWEFIAVAKK